MADAPWGFTHSNIYGMAMAVYYTTETPPSLSIACPLQNTGTIGVEYSSALVATGGTSPYTFAIIGGILPYGLTLDTGTGLISGIPIIVGTYPYEAQVTDSLGAIATANCSIVISSGGGGGGSSSGRCYNVQPSGVMPTLEITRDLDADWTDQSTFIITQSDPLPFTLRGIVLRMSFNPD